MARVAAASGVADPLSGFIGPSLFPRTFKASASLLMPSDPKNLDSIHSLMKSLELRSPEKLMNEAKRIVDGVAEFLESNLSNFLENVGTNDATHAQGKDKPQDRRPGLGLVRKRASFSLKTNISQPTVTWKNNVDLDSIVDPDEYFDAYERMEKANKELQKQVGGNVDKFSLYNPSNNERRRRPGILGKTYTYKHRFSKGPSENDVTLMSLQEIADADIPRSQEENSQTVDEEDILKLPEDYVPKVVEEDIPGPPEDPNPDFNLEEVEAGSMKKAENEYSNILQEVLSFNYEDLQGQGALNLLQERLNIKPLDIENLGMTNRLDVGMRNRTSISTVPDSHRKSVRNSLIDRALQNLNRKPTMEHEEVLDPINRLSSPTPPRSPFASPSLLKKKILQPNSLGDPFLSTDVELSKRQSAFAVQLEDKLSGQVDAPDDMGMSNELESHVDAINTETLVFNVNAREDLGNTDGLPKLLVDENGGLQNTHDDSRPFEEHVNYFDRTMNVNENTDESNPSVVGEEARDNMPRRQQTDSEQQPEIETLDFNVDAREDLGNTDDLPKLLVDENAGLHNAHDDSRPAEEHDNDFDRTKNVKKNESNPSVCEEARDNISSRQQTDPEQQPEEYQTKHPRRTTAAGEKRIRKYHPMRKSLADGGTSFESGVRRSKRVKMRALEYWRGERFLYGRVDDSLKLIGVKYMSPGKGNENLKVKPYILSESSKLKEFLEMEACHQVY